MVKRKKTIGQTIIYKTQHRKLQTHGILKEKLAKLQKKTQFTLFFNVIAHLKEQKSENGKSVSAIFRY
jgi:hypothetical protein